MFVAGILMSLPLYAFATPSDFVFYCPLARAFDMLSSKQRRKS
jgi:hypothetical protein